MKHFRVGDSITKLDETAVGVIATYDASPGVGTLVANAQVAVTILEKVKVAEAELSVENKNALILCASVEMEAMDMAESGFFEGFFKADEKHTAHVVSKIGYLVGTELRVRG